MLYSFEGRQPVTGQETYVSETAILIGDVKIGDNCYIGHGAILRADYGAIEIGDGSAVEEGVIIHVPPDEKCVIGEKVTIGHGAIVHAKSIGNKATIGMGSVLSIRSEIGENSIVAEGCVVKMAQKIPDNVVVAGNPARIARHVSGKDTRLWDYGKQLYIDLAKKYLKVGIQKIG